jgi:two-component sensor histidine kinase
MYTVKVYDLENNQSYEDNLEHLDDYHSNNVKTYDNVPPFNNPKIIDCIDLSFGILLPYNDGEDFYYQYINKPIFSGSENYSKTMIGKSYLSLFENLPNINLIRFLQRAWHENRRVEIRVELFEDNILKFGFNMYFVRNENQLYAIGKEVNELVALQMEEDNLLNSSNEGIILINNNNQILLSNEKFFNIVGISEDELVLKDGLNRLIHSIKFINSDISSYDDLIKHFDLIFNREISSLSLEVIPKNRLKEYYQVNVFPIIYRNQEVLRISVDNISESKLQEIRALRLNNILNTMQDLASVALGYCETDNKKIQWTSEVYNILEIDSDVDVSNFKKCKEFILPEDLLIHDHAFSRLSVNNPNIEFTIRVKTAKGNIKFIRQFYKSFYDELGDMSLFVIYSQDITKTQVELDQKDMLVKEVHHRVKNNLQIIISLLNLDLRFHPDDPMSVISDTRARLNYMSNLHEKIYKTSDLTNVDIKEYLPDIIISLLRLYNSEISFNEDLDSQLISLDIAIPIGLIVTEIVNNTIKYAFPNGDVGSFNVKFRVDGVVGVLECWDDGVGLPEDLNINNDNLGMTVVNSLANQIDGEVNLLSENGTYYQLIFPLN